MSRGTAVEKVPREDCARVYPPQATPPWHGQQHHVPIWVQVWLPWAALEGRQEGCEDAHVDILDCIYIEDAHVDILDCIYIKDAHVDTLDCIYIEDAHVDILGYAYIEDAHVDILGARGYACEEGRPDWG